MNYKTLSEKKDLIMTLITQKNSHNVVFETLLLMCRTGERGLDYFDIDALSGYADEVNNSKDDILPILKEMIDTGEIDCSMMTPQLRLMIILSSVGVKTIEKNNDKKKKCYSCARIITWNRWGRRAIDLPYRWMRSLYCTKCERRY